jgi:type II secretory pathway pseudopilin PulG
VGASRVRRRIRDDSGDTLVEILIALLVVAVTATALLAAFATSITASGEQRGLATIDTVMKNYVESAIFQIQNQPYSAANNTFPIFAGCGTASKDYYTTGIQQGQGSNGVVLYTIPSGYTAQITAVQFWDTAQSPPSWQDISACTPASSTSLNPQLLTATVTGPNATTATVQFAVSNPKVPVGSASQLVVSTQPPANVTAGATFNVGFTVEDSLGHVVTTSAATVTITISSGTGTAGAVLTCSGGLSIAASSGVAAFSCGINLAGSGYTLTATSPGLTAVTTNPLTVVPGVPRALVFDPDPPGGGSAVTDNPIPSVTVDVVDSQNNVVTSATGQITMTIGSGSPQAQFDGGPAPPVTLVNGVAQFTSLQVSTPGTYTLVATPNGISGLSSSQTSQSFPVSLEPNVLRLVFTTQPGGGPNGQQWAQSGAPVVAIQNGFGQTQSNRNTTVTLAISSHPGTAQPLTCTTFGTSILTTNGVASFAGCSITGTAGTTYQLTATASNGSEIIGATSAQFTITVGSPFQLQFGTQPGDTRKNRALNPQPVLLIQDSGGNQTSSTASVSAQLVQNGNSGSILTCPPVNAVSGQATFSGCSINKAGNGYQIKFNSVGLQSVTSSAFNITP